MDVSTLIYLQGIVDPLREVLNGVGIVSIVCTFFAFSFMVSDGARKLWVGLVLFFLTVSALAFIGHSVIPDSGTITMMIEQINGLG